MTNLDIIKHLVNNNPTRLAELLDDIYCCAWNNGAYANSKGCLSENEIHDFNDWLGQDISKAGFYNDEEIEEWYKLRKGNKDE